MSLNITIPGATIIFSKKLKKIDKKYQLIVSTKLFRRQFSNGEGHERDFTAYDGQGRKWPFILARRKTGKYEKPVIRPGLWHKFVVQHGLHLNDGAYYGVVFYKLNNDPDAPMEVRVCTSTLRFHGEQLWILL